jgi:hypothetical protein
MERGSIAPRNRASRSKDCPGGLLRGAVVMDVSISPISAQAEKCTEC